MKDMERKGRWAYLLLGGLGCTAVVGGVYILSLYGLGIPCLFYRLTGYSCPGCGNSRAALALLRLDLSGALGYNLLFPVEFFYLGWVCFHGCRSYLRSGRLSYSPPWPWLDGAVLILVLLWWPLRNWLGL